jgi:hypothetical protein
LMPVFRTIDAAPGDAPGPAFPAGTVYVATMDPKTDAPVSVTEWDLARASIVRSLVLPISTDEVESWIRRDGDHLRVLVSGPESVSYLQLTRDLRVEHTERWMAQQQCIAAFSADEDLVAVAYSGHAETVSGGAYGVLVATFDGSGRRLAHRLVQRPATPDSRVGGVGGNVAVADGRVFLLLYADHPGLELLKLTPDLRVEKRVVVSPEANLIADLHAWGGSLQVDIGDHERAVQFSTNLERLGATTPAEESFDMKVGDETVSVCGHNAAAWLAWSTTVADPCSASPSYLRNAPPPGEKP